MDTPDVILMLSIFVPTRPGVTLLRALYRRYRSPQALRSSRFVSPADEQEWVALVRSAEHRGELISTRQTRSSFDSSTESGMTDWYSRYVSCSTVSHRSPSPAHK